MPPTTPPTIAPVLDDEWFEDEFAAPVSAAPGIVTVVAIVETMVDPAEFVVLVMM